MLLVCVRVCFTHPGGGCLHLVRLNGCISVMCGVGGSSLCGVGGSSLCGVGGSSTDLLSLGACGVLLLPTLHAHTQSCHRVHNIHQHTHLDLTRGSLLRSLEYNILLGNIFLASSGAEQLAIYFLVVMATLIMNILNIQTVLQVMIL